MQRSKRAYTFLAEGKYVTTGGFCVFGETAHAMPITLSRFLLRGGFKKPRCYRVWDFVSWHSFAALRVSRHQNKSGEAHLFFCLAAMGRGLCVGIAAGHFGKGRFVRFY